MASWEDFYKYNPKIGRISPDICTTFGLEGKFLVTN